MGTCGRARLRRPEMLAPAISVGLGVGALSALYALDPSERAVFIPCPFRLLTGVDCPLCGGLRMMHSVLHVDLAAAADYNVVALAALPAITFFWVRWMVRRLRERSAAGGVAPQWVPVAMAVLLIAWTLVRNLPLEPFTILRS
ncbi:MAG: DUF2752 domain-containing protein [Pseudonocardiaceae bacterium]